MLLKPNWTQPLLNIEQKPAQYWTKAGKISNTFYTKTLAKSQVNNGLKVDKITTEYWSEMGLNTMKYWAKPGL